MDEHGTAAQTRAFLRAVAVATLAIVGCEGGLISGELPGVARPDSGSVVDAGFVEDAGDPPDPDAGSEPELCTGAAGWKCGAGGVRERCDGGVFEAQSCARGCWSGDTGALCVVDGGSWPCASSAYQGTQFWTCVAGELRRCDAQGPVKVVCPHGCTYGPVGTDDGCDGPPPPVPDGGVPFGYPVGDKSSFPAGGWLVSQVLGHYLYAPPFVGGHLAEDIFSGAEATTANAQVYAVADGVVRYAGPNASTYKHVVLIEHPLGGGKAVCSFYGHLSAPSVTTGMKVKRGAPIARVLDWNAVFGGANSHLHYVLLTLPLCNTSVAASGALVCGYDKTSGPNGILGLSTAPETYQSVGDVCGNEQFGKAFIAPSQFIKKHHF